jgi:hypothetical protein
MWWHVKILLEPLGNRYKVFDGTSLMRPSSGDMPSRSQLASAANVCHSHRDPLSQESLYLW